MDFDQVIDAIGSFGPYQKRLFWLIQFCVIPAVFICFLQVFTSAAPKHWCRAPEEVEKQFNSNYTAIKALMIPEENGDFSSCRMYKNSTRETSECEFGWIYDRSDFDETLVTQFDLVCDNEWWVSTSTSLFFAGSLVGAPIFAVMSDTWGRRTTFVFLVNATVAVSLLIGLSPNYLVYTLFRVASGLLFPAVFQVGYVSLLEIVAPSMRNTVAMVLNGVCGFYMGLISLAAYYTRHWRTLLVISGCSFIPMLSYYWLISESPRWLLTKDPESAEKLVQKIARINGKRIPANILERVHVQEEKKVSPIVLVKTFNMRTKFLIMVYIQCVLFITFSCLPYYSGSMPGSIFTSFALGGLVEVPSCFLGWLTVDRYGRKSVTLAALFIGGICLLSVALAPVSWTVPLVVIGRGGSCLAFTSCVLHLGELFPTVVRNQAMGLSGFVASAGVLLVPTIISLGAYSTNLPYIILGVGSVSAGLAGLVVPETLGHPLPDTVEQAETLPLTLSCFSPAPPSPPPVYTSIPVPPPNSNKDTL